MEPSQSTSQAITFGHLQTQVEQLTAENQTLAVQMENVANLWEQERTNKERLQQAIFDNQAERAQFADRVDSNIKRRDEEIAQLKTQVELLQKKLQETQSVHSSENKQNELQKTALRNQNSKQEAKLKAYQKFYAKVKEVAESRFIQGHTKRQYEVVKAAGFLEDYKLQEFLRSTEQPEALIASVDAVKKDLLDVDRKHK